jgi:hypothetical protein
VHTFMITLYGSPRGPYSATAGASPVGGGGSGRLRDVSHSGPAARAAAWRPRQRDRQPVDARGGPDRALSRLVHTLTPGGEPIRGDGHAGLARLRPGTGLHRPPSAIAWQEHGQRRIRSIPSPWGRGTSAA